MRIVFYAYVEETLADVDYLLGDVSQLQHSSALFLLKLKEERRLTQVAIDDVVEGIEAVLEKSVIRAKAGVRAKLATEGIDPDTITGLDEVFLDATHPFSGLETGKVLQRCTWTIGKYGSTSKDHTRS